MLRRYAEAARMAEVETTYISRLVREKSLQKHEVNGKSYIDDSEPRFIQLLNRNSKPLDPEHTSPVDWDEWEAMMYRGERICKKACTERSVKISRYFASRFLNTHPTVSYEAVRSELARYEALERGHRASNHFSTKYAMWLAIRHITAYLEWKQQVPQGTWKELENLRPRNINPEPVQRFFTRDEILGTIPAIQRACTPRGGAAYSTRALALNTALISFLWYTAARAFETINVLRTDITWGKKPSVKLYGKRNTPRVVGLHPSLIGTLEEYLAVNHDKSQKLLFPSTTGTRLTIRTLHKRIVSAGEWNNLENLHPHAIRRSSLTHMVTVAGIALPTVQRISGHKSLQALERYLNTGQETALDAMYVSNM